MRVSAIVPCYDGFPFVQQAVTSALQQDWPDVEVVLVDDGSTDGSGALLDLLGRHLPRVVVVHQENRGLAAARNAGIRAATGELLAFLDSDDRVLPHAYRTLARPLADDPSLVASGGLAQYLSADGRRTFGTTGQTPDPLPMEEIRAGRLVPWPPVACLVRTSAAHEAGLFDESRSLVPGFPEDMDLWMRLARLGGFAVTREVVAQYRVHGSSISAARGEALAEQTVLLREDRPQGRAFARRSRAARHYRNAGVSLLNGRYASAVVSAARAALGDPPYVARRAAAQLRDREAAAATAVAPRPVEPLRRDVALTVLVASHDRRELTVRCVRALQRAAARAECRVRLVWVDDGCTDGSREAVVAAQPDVEVVVGDGSLYYAGAMRAAYEHLATDPRDTDAVLFLNDDVVLGEEALVDVVRELRADLASGALSVLAGTTADPATGRVNYGGLRRRSAVRLSFDTVSSSEPVDVDAAAGNVLVVPWPLLLHLGGPSEGLRHRWSDLDLTMRARAAGWPVRTLGGVQGTCDSNTTDGWWKAPGLSVRERWGRLQHPKGLPTAEYHWFVRRHAGPRGQVLHVMPYLHFAAATLRRRARHG